MGEIKVSVLITFYNQAGYVDRTLNSVMSQETDFEYEVIIGDDGSTDDTIERICYWQLRYPNIKYFVMERDAKKNYDPILRVSQNRIRLLEEAKGEYFLYLDGDDFYTDTKKLQKQVNVLEQDKRCVACAHNANLYWEDSGKIKEINSWKKLKTIKVTDYWSKYYFLSESFMFRHIFKEGLPSIIRSLPFDDNIITLFMINGKCHIVYLPDNMVNYTQREESSWNNRSRVEKVLISALDYYQEKKFAPNMRRYSFCRHEREFWELFLNRYNLKRELLPIKWQEIIEELNARELEDIIDFRLKSGIEKFQIQIRMTFKHVLRRLI